MVKVNRAVARGQLTRPDHCEACGKFGPKNSRGQATIHGHHHKGYDAEHVLDVVWLCAPCHRLAHPEREGWHQKRNMPSPKGRKLNLTDDERRARSERAKRQRPCDARWGAK